MLISTELANDVPEFMAHCAERGHEVQVFDTGAAPSEETRRQPRGRQKRRARKHENRRRAELKATTARLHAALATLGLAYGWDHR